MANESVGRDVPRVLTLDEEDWINRLLYQAAAIADLISAASNAPEGLTDAAIPGGCWAVRDLLGQVGAIVGTIQGRSVDGVRLAARGVQ